jgi:hypothetical protein
VRRASDLSLFGEKPAMSSAHRSRAARSFATSMKKFIPVAKKNERRGANASTSIPDATPVRTYSSPSASV